MTLNGFSPIKSLSEPGPAGGPSLGAKAELKCGTDVLAGLSPGVTTKA